MTYINAQLTKDIQVHSQFNQINLVFRNSPVCYGNQVTDNLNFILMAVNSGLMKARVQRRIHEGDQFEYWKHTWHGVSQLELVEIEGLGRCLQWATGEEGVKAFAPVDQELPGIFSVTLSPAK
jgi:hypothetical protein